MAVTVGLGESSFAWFGRYNFGSLDPRFADIVDVAHGHCCPSMLPMMTTGADGVGLAC